MRPHDKQDKHHSLSPDFLDVLPFRPKPRRLESIYSYVMRLAQGNGIQTPSHLCRELFPGVRPSNIRLLSDISLTRHDTLGRKTLLTEEELLSTTVCYLLRKFGQFSYDVMHGRFLSGSLSSSLRYCPRCLEQDRDTVLAPGSASELDTAGIGGMAAHRALLDSGPYYRIPWRFLMLEGCPWHKVRLLDRCGHCGEQFEFLHTNLQIAVCPRCDGDLARCKVDPIDDDRLPVIKQRWDDLEFLLLPQPWETDDSYQAAREIGRKYASMRRIKHLGEGGFGRAESAAEGEASSLEQTAAALETSVAAIRYLETPRPPSYSTRQPGAFSLYVGYADYLGQSIKSIFGHLPPSSPSDLPGG